MDEMTKRIRDAIERTEAALNGQKGSLTNIRDKKKYGQFVDFDCVIGECSPMDVDAVMEISRGKRHILHLTLEIKGPGGKLSEGERRFYENQAVALARGGYENVFVYFIVHNVTNPKRNVQLSECRVYKAFDGHHPELCWTKLPNITVRELMENFSKILV